MFVTTRVSDSDDLKMTESEVGRLAVAIEKEMFNLCLSTDSKYKNKYRSLMFNLKDPKNKVSSCANFCFPSLADAPPAEILNNSVMCLS